MIRRDRPNIAALMAKGTPIDEALTRGIREALLRHKRLGQSIAIWRNGRPVLIPPEEIPVDEFDSKTEEKP